MEDRIQILLAVAKQSAVAHFASLGGLIMGITLGLISPASTMLSNNYYAFSVTSNDLSNIIEMMKSGAFISALIMTYLVDKLGRKTLMIVMNIPTMIGLALIIWAQSVYYIFLGMFSLGFASSAFSTIVPLYTTEIADKKIRGALGSYFQLYVMTGILGINLFGHKFGFLAECIFAASFSVLYFVGLFSIPESPYYYLMKNDSEKARLPLKFFLGSDDKVNEEIDNTRKYLAQSYRDTDSLPDVFDTEAAKRALLIGIGSMAFQQFCGSYAVTFYSKFILNKTEISQNLDESIIISITCIVGIYFTGVSMRFVDILGRKVLLLVSALVMGLCTFLIGGFFFGKDWNYDVSSVTFIPLIFIFVYTAAFSIGFGPIPRMMMCEIFPARIKGIGVSLTSWFGWSFGFWIIGNFSIFKSIRDIQASFSIFTIVSIFGILYVLKVVSETKGKKLDEIQEMLNSIEPTLPRCFYFYFVILTLISASYIRVNYFNYTSKFNSTNDYSN